MTAPERDVVEVTVGVTRPFATAPLLGYLGVRAVAGVEEVKGKVYRRIVALEGNPTLLTIDLSTTETDSTIRASCTPRRKYARESLGALVTRVVDGDAPVDRINATLGADPLLAPLVKRTPGMRIPGAVDPFELAVRAILGQQVSVGAASTFAAKITAAWGAPLARPLGTLCRAFPGPAKLAHAPMEKVGVTKGRASAIRHLARATVAGDLQLHPGGEDVTHALETALVKIPGIGPWTAGYVALRGLGDRDAIPTSDLGLRQALGNENPWSARQVAERAERWRPWRGYAAAHLWSTYLP